MPLELPPLPYTRSALAPYISERTIGYHYGKHHAGYFAAVNKAVAGTPQESLSLEELVRSTHPDAQRGGAPSALFNAAAQAWNHTFYWHSMTPDGGGEPDGDLRAAIEASFGSVGAMLTEFADGAAANFASGWGWLVCDPTGGPAGQGAGSLAVVQTNDAATPLVGPLRPLLVIDVWEHAYYLDRFNDRRAYIDVFVEHLINWEFAATNLTAATAS